MSTSALFSEQLEATRPKLYQLVARFGAQCLRYETADDLVQGICVRALEQAPSFEWRGEREFRAWITTIGRGYLSDRREHWRALRRGAHRILRISFGGTHSRESQQKSASGSVAAPGPSPSSVAGNREALSLAAKVLAALPPRDRDLVRWMGEGIAITEQAVRMGVSYEAAQRAGRRALDRFRKTFVLFQKAQRLQG